MPFREEVDQSPPTALRLAKAAMPASVFWDWLRQHPPAELTGLPPDVALHDLLYLKGAVIFVLRSPSFPVISPAYTIPTVHELQLGRPDESPG